MQDRYTRREFLKELRNVFLVGTSVVVGVNVVKLLGETQDQGDSLSKCPDGSNALSYEQVFEKHLTEQIRPSDLPPVPGQNKDLIKYGEKGPRGVGFDGSNPKKYYGEYYGYESHVDENGNWKYCRDDN